MSEMSDMTTVSPYEERTISLMRSFNLSEIADYSDLIVNQVNAGRINVSRPDTSCTIFYGHISL